MSESMSSNILLHDDLSEANDRVSGSPYFLLLFVFAPLM